MRHPKSQRWIVRDFCTGQGVGEVACWWRTTPACVLACLRWALDGYDGDPPELQLPPGQQERLER